MSRKSLIICLATLAAMLVALGVAIAFLYSGTGSSQRSRRVSLDDNFICFQAVPSDAALVAGFSHAGRAVSGTLSGTFLADSLSSWISDGSLESFRKCPMSVSLHYSGKLVPLYVIFTGKASDGAAATLADMTENCGFKTAGTGDFMVISESDNLVRSALRHIEQGLSVLDTPGFSDALECVEGRDALLISHLHLRKLMSAYTQKKLQRHSDFLERTADWSAFSLDGGYSLKGRPVYGSEADEFLTALEDCDPSVCEAADFLPSYTLFAASLSLKDFDEYSDGYQAFIDSRQKLQDFKAVQKSLGAKAGMMPEDLFQRLQLKELATAVFKVAGNREKVNLFNVESEDACLIFKGNEVSSMRGYVPSVHTWAYPGFAASVYGKLFDCADESCFTYIDGWIITGSRAAIEDYIERNSLDYTLNGYLADAGTKGLLSHHPSLATVYFSFSEDRDELQTCLKPEVLTYISPYMEDADCAPAVLTVGKDGDGLYYTLDMLSLQMKKTKAPSFERDTTVVVPVGPFGVMNSHTGKMNTFYQNAQNALCLRDENGKDQWGVPFGKPICGAVHSIDFYANGKLQYLFGAGSSVYLIDRLGRYVNGFPVDLGKEILIGPAAYDFTGARRYNIMVLHKDNTIQMYNLKGKMPQAWKGITAAETIKALPERLIIDNHDFWIVRTSIQTLIFPFYGGEPLTVYEGDLKIRPDSEVKIADGTSVQVSCYDGKIRTVKLL